MINIILKWIWDDQRANDWVIFKLARWISSFIVKSFIKSYLFQFYENTSHDELFLSCLFDLKNGVLFSGFVKKLQ